MRTGPPPLDHLLAMTDDVGLFQHARREIPSRAHGYCTDDIGRALIVACDAANDPVTAPAGARLVATYLAFLADAQQQDGWFHNFMGYDRRWQDERGSADSFGRALWGLGYAARYAPRPAARALALDLLRAAERHVSTLSYLRARAYAALGLVHVVAADRFNTTAWAGTALWSAADAIAAAYRSQATPDWAWCEGTLTYDNARLCEALLRAGAVLHEPELIEIGQAMLDFYARVTLEADTFVPIGNAGWYKRGGERARFDQQPLEAAAVVDAGLVAYELTGDERYRAFAGAGYGWFFGRNVRGATLVHNGGCRDGIGARGINENMGAESTLAYLMSAFATDRSSSLTGRGSLLSESRL